MFTDTHTHLYLNAFDEDRGLTIKKAIDQDVKYMLLPNIDSGSVEDMLSLCRQFPENCFPMMGLHPTSVKENYREELQKVKECFDRVKFIAVGEIGIDLYWDKAFVKEQEEAFRFQIDLAIEKDLPIVIHSRDSFNEIFNILKDYRNTTIKGVFHCFTGSIEQAYLAIDMGFYLGIGGVLTFKNSGLDKVVEQIDIKHLLLETDSPFLAPVPFRGKRNESAYINIIAGKLAEIKKTDKEKIADITTQNAIRLFNFV
ncbi:MAG: TatD family hydrolase [Bacteroidales bacterium]|nr:TatD family hydrolase [Bacteroidales bacterium]MCF8403765.1 TatD family hydrolase [Bacteroidales bacterium]